MTEAAVPSDDHKCVTSSCCTEILVGAYRYWYVPVYSPRMVRLITAKYGVAGPNIIPVSMHRIIRRYEYIAAALRWHTGKEYRPTSMTSCGTYFLFGMWFVRPLRRGLHAGHDAQDAA